MVLRQNSSRYRCHNDGANEVVAAHLIVRRRYDLSVDYRTHRRKRSIECFLAFELEHTLDWRTVVVGGGQLPTVAVKVAAMLLVVAAAAAEDSEHVAELVAPIYHLSWWLANRTNCTKPVRFRQTVVALMHRRPDDGVHPRIPVDFWLAYDSWIFDRTP